MKKYLFLIPMFCFIFASFASAADPKISFATKSIYRKIDKTGATLPKDLKNMIIPKVGVGNFIFSSGDLPFEQEDTYQNIGTSFNFKDVEQKLVARAYFPGKREDLIAYVIAKKPKFEFVNSVGIVTWKKPDQDISHAQIAGKPVWTLSEDSLTWDQSKYDIFPTQGTGKVDSLMQDFFENSAPDTPGVHNIAIQVYLRFTTGEYKKVSRWEGDTLVTENVPYYADYLIAYGDVNIDVPKK